MGASPDRLDPHRIETTTPAETLERVYTYLETRSIEAVGIASFGPLDLDIHSAGFGSILSTPKPGWSGTPLHSAMTDRLGVPVAIHTDVVGAALGEGRWGAARGCDHHAYITVGTGIGVGVVAGGEILRGRRHPELGHIPVRRLEGDEYGGRCPFHQACMEGMASGPAIQDRFGPPGDRGGSEAVLTASGYLAQVIAVLVYTYAPQRIVVGGGVASSPHFYEALSEASHDALGGYPVEEDLEDLIVPPGLGDLAGLAGGLVLARQALT